MAKPNKRYTREKPRCLLGLNWVETWDEWTGQIVKITEKYKKTVRGIARTCKFLNFKHRKQLVEASLISHLRYAIEIHSQGTVGQIWKAEGIVSKGARIVLGKGRRNWST